MTPIWQKMLAANKDINHEGQYMRTEKKDI
jgi:hypothetical protein